MKTNINVTAGLTVNNCSLLEGTIVWEPVSRIIGTQHLLVGLMNDAHKVRKTERYGP
jgi:hypothetical protein